jgi:hypothetical protein
MYRFFENKYPLVEALKLTATPPNTEQKTGVTASQKKEKELK